MTELKPCPFCGGHAIANEMMIQFRVQCLQDCTGYFDTERKAIEAWNRREGYDDLVKTSLEVMAERDKLLVFVLGKAKIDGELRDPDELWRDAETVQDGIDYADHSNAKEARELLKEIGIE